MGIVFGTNAALCGSLDPQGKRETEAREDSCAHGFQHRLPLRRAHGIAIEALGQHSKHIADVQVAAAQICCKNESLTDIRSGVQTLRRQCCGKLPAKA